jgi:hypothetical protein
MPWILEAWKHRRDKRMSRSKWFALTIVSHPKVAAERTSKGDGLGHAFSRVALLAPQGDDRGQRLSFNQICPKRKQPA